MSIPYVDHPPHRLILNDDGTFTVKAGECLSKYNWAINGNWGNEKTWDLFRRPGGPQGKKIDNYNLIRTGETLLYLPDYKAPGQKPGDPGKTPGTEPKPGNGNGNGSKPGWEFQVPMYEKTSKLKEMGNFLVQMKVTAKGSVSTRGVTVRAGDEDKLAGQIADDLSKAWVTQVDKTVTIRELGQVVLAAKNGDINAFNEAMGDLVSWGMSTSYDFKGCVIRPGFGFESSLTPVLLTATFDKSGTFVFQGGPVDYSGSFSVTVKVGLSRQGWAYLVDKIGIPAVRAFVQRIGLAVALEVGAWCGFAMLAVGATLMMVYLFEWIMDFGKANEFAPVYARTYVDSVFHPEWFRVPQAAYAGPPGHKMVVAAVRDVIADMQEQGIEVPSPADPAFEDINSTFWNPNRKALATYKRYLVAAADNNEGNAESRLYNAAYEKARKM